MRQPRGDTIDPARRVVRLSDVCREIGLSSSTFRRMCREGRGPQLLQLSERRLGVRRGDLDAWIKNQRQAPIDEEQPGGVVVPETPAVPIAQVDMNLRRGLRRDEAARYIGVSPAKFDELVRDGRMPRAKRIDSYLLWDLRMLDSAWDALVDDEDKRAPKR